MNLKAITAKKSLGQNFLIDRNIARKIISLLDIKEGDEIVEIGPGTGALTSLILDHNCNLTAIELDKRAIDELESKFPKSKFPNFNLINQNIMDYEFSNIKGKELKVIGNIPYYLSSEIIFKILEAKANIKFAVLTIQKELAQRLVAKPSTKDYGILTLAINLNGKCKIEMDISPKCFHPIPRVWSSVVKIDLKEQKEADNYSEVMKIIRLAFNQRRKMISNTLKSYLSKLDIEKLNASDKDTLDNLLSKRPEQLLVNDFVFLYNIFSEKTK